MVYQPYNRVLHLLAWLTTLATFPLIWMGGLVTSHQAGLSVPDWPNSFGYNMFALPWSYWERTGVFYEHSHRLLGTVVGILALAMVAAAYVHKRRAQKQLSENHGKKLARRQFWLAVAILVAIIIQGTLGGLRVVLVNLDLAVVHGIFAQAALCLMGWMIVISSRWWLDAPDLKPEAVVAGRKLWRLAVVTVAVIFGQLIVGAIMRHYQAGLAIPDVPLNYGHLLPPISQDGLNEANLMRMNDPALGQVTMEQIWMHFAHRVGAVIVTIFVIWTTIRAMKMTRGTQSGLRGMSIGLHVLILIQLTLGILTVLMRKPADVASAHVAVGAITLFVMFMLTVRIYRVFRHGAELIERQPRKSTTAVQPGLGATAS